MFAKETFCENKLHMIFNKNNVKIRYSCMSNISSQIVGHNKSLLQPKITKHRRNCWVKNTYPLQSQCQNSNLIYRADVENEINDETKTYFRLAATTFEERFRNHKKYFNGKHHSKNTELLKYVWSLKDVKYHTVLNDQ